ncbi:EscU/YscU/HrcU family type III secretion system export apparatus switch protein [Bacillus sp. PS06]|uniref:EscU/YscU/HrcU family type III secretion system export apparatus switch protein n=1 Tax=Bacillus sp. PS06 TaxID=2764176 RepID=UPI00178205BF|nr:EscU/YscU/HrcU family type III secretion system export apparatus switch protein [Bacillus sp. PS06]MBD8068315.1 EscU/YscU/HrcU family type III secretion system export apparatus switch protein [Bacillus sp. PS06]
MKHAQHSKKAIALRYQPDKDAAPTILAKGKGIAADRMIETAKQHHIPIEENHSLSELLVQLNINEQIPEELYKAVAEVFAFIYQTDKKFKEQSK